VAGSRVHSHSGSQTHLRILAACSPELCFVVSPSIERGRREDRVPAGTRGPLCEIVVTRLHSGIQVKPNIRPSLRGGFTAYVALSPGSDALLPPSPCGWLTRAPGWAAHITATLDAQTPGARTTRFRRTPITPVVCARPSLTVARPAKPFAPMSPTSTAVRPAFVTIAIRPSSLGRVTARHTPFPNFGKAEYF
jgi:hypothetical protein